MGTWLGAPSAALEARNPPILSREFVKKILTSNSTNPFVASSPLKSASKRDYVACAISVEGTCVT